MEKSTINKLFKLRFYSLSIKNYRGIRSENITANYPCFKPDPCVLKRDMGFFLVLCVKSSYI